MLTAGEGAEREVLIMISRLAVPATLPIPRFGLFSWLLLLVICVKVVINKSD